VWASVVGSTLIAYYYDQDIYDSVRDYGNRIGLNEKAQMAKLFCINKEIQACLQVPSDTATSLYYLGDGMTYLLMSSSFLVYGSLNNDNRALSTGYQIIEGVVDIGIMTQILKRMAGRETPERLTEPRGKWKPFVNLATYQNNIPKYDAFPSGHVAAMSVAFTILNENYPEYSTLIKSTYGVALSLVSLEMMHLGVHWASDYPLGIAIGYYFGKVVSDRYKPKNYIQTLKSNDINTIITPIFSKNTYGVQVGINF